MLDLSEVEKEFWEIGKAVIASLISSGLIALIKLPKLHKPKRERKRKR